MHFGRGMIVLDAADLDAESAFWAGLLGGKVMAGEQIPAGHPFCLCWLPPQPGND